MAEREDSLESSPLDPPTTDPNPEEHDRTSTDRLREDQPGEPPRSSTDSATRTSLSRRPHLHRSPEQLPTSPARTSEQSEPAPLQTMIAASGRTRATLSRHPPPEDAVDVDLQDMNGEPSGSQQPPTRPEEKKVPNEKKGRSSSEPFVFYERRSTSVMSPNVGVCRRVLYVLLLVLVDVVVPLGILLLLPGLTPLNIIIILAIATALPLVKLIWSLIWTRRLDFISLLVVTALTTQLILHLTATPAAYFLILAALLPPLTLTLLFLLTTLPFVNYPATYHIARELSTGASVRAVAAWDEVVACDEV
ncbi:hypothetical protein HK104_005020, partial [Borealophlyctis nickersoniae]